jgi:GMP synthase (glutamine-hydrolysing)
MILLINICKEKLHELEFVKPIEDILTKDNLTFKTKSYQTLSQQDINEASKIIICGTSLKDNEFLIHINKFNWIKNYNKPILGICGGMHILHLIHKGKKKSKLQIGLVRVNFEKDFLGIKGEKQVYNLHQYYFNTKEFETFAEGQASKHTSKPFYTTLFHPEVRNKEIINNFTKL